MSSDTLNKEDYLDMVRKLSEEQYDQIDDLESSDMDVFAPSDIESQVAAKKERMLQLMNQATIDLTKVKKNQLAGSLFKHNNIRVFDFTIRITKYYGEPGQTGANLNVDITLYHERHKTELSGAPCRMTETLDIGKDSRFVGRPWLRYFVGCHGKNIPADALIDIIRWMQVISKLPAFL